MDLNFNYDQWENMEIPSFVLCNADGRRVGILNCCERKLSVTTEIPELSFKIYKYIEGKDNPYYDKVLPLQYIELENMGKFQITREPETITDEEVEYKEVTAQSVEIELGQKYLNTFMVNTGTIGDAGQYGDVDEPKYSKTPLYRVDYDPDPSKNKLSLMHMILEKFPAWGIGSIEPSLQSLIRSFEIDNQDVYSFLMEDMATAYECVFTFTTLLTPEEIKAHNGCHYLINAISKKTLEENRDTNIIVSFKNLAKQVNIEPNIDNIKTCVTLVGDNDLSVREVNLGYDTIYNFDWFANTDYWSQDLIDKYKEYKKTIDECTKQYSPLIQEYQRLQRDLAYHRSEMLPDDAAVAALHGKPLTALPGRDPKDPTKVDEDNEDVTDDAFNNYISQCSLNELNTYKKAIENTLSVWMEKYGKPKNEKGQDVPEYNNFYLPTWARLQLVKTEITKREGQISGIQKEMNVNKTQRDAIIAKADIRKTFTDNNQWITLSKFIREDTINDSNYIVTDEMSESEKQDMLNSFKEFGDKELLRVSQPEYTFSLDMVNIYNIPEFRDYARQFKLHNFITIRIRDEEENVGNNDITNGTYCIKAKILAFDLDFENKNNFNVTFGSIYRYRDTNKFGTLEGAIAGAASAATTVSFNKFQWNEANNKSVEINEMINSGLINAGKSLTNSRSTMEIDERGLFMKNDEGSDYPKDQCALTGSNLLFTTDSWMTVKTALGRISYTKKNGYTENTYGLIAETVLSGYIAGTEIEGGTITGAEFNNGNGTFKVDSDGKLTASKAIISGDITANSGKIGGWTIGATDIYHNGGNDASVGMSVHPLNSTASTDLVFWAGGGVDKSNCKFTVDFSGKVTCKNIDAIGGKIGGWTIGSEDILHEDDANNASTGMSMRRKNGSINDAAFWAGGQSWAVKETSKFYVTHAGKLVCKDIDAQSGKIAGCTITNTSIKADNWEISSSGTVTFNNGTIGGCEIYNGGIRSKSNKWSITSNGYAYFENVASGSSFGGVSVNNGITVYNSTAKVPFTGSCADYIEELTVGKLNALNIVAETIEGKQGIKTGVIKSESGYISDVYCNLLHIGNNILNVNYSSETVYIKKYECSWKTLKQISENPNPNMLILCGTL